MRPEKRRTRVAVEGSVRDEVSEPHRSQQPGV